MKKLTDLKKCCTYCHQHFSMADLIASVCVRAEISEEIKRDCPEWNSTSYICYVDLALMRSRYVHKLLLSEKGELTFLETEVVRSLHEHELLSTNVEAEFEQKWTLGERLADKIASFGGSWSFLICFAFFLILWVGANTLVFYWWHAPDPYPFIFLNLILSCLAAIQAPVIMMSQNRQETKDRIRSQHDYQINLKAELEIRHLHEKMDHMLSHQWEKLVQIQEIQLELLSELNAKRSQHLL